jgi:hypothetical protein
MPDKQLLVDCMNFEVSSQQINESMKENDGKLVVSGVLQRADAKNQNGRIYPRDVLVREAKKYASVQIKERRALGELDHPDSSVVNLNNVSHNIRTMSWQGDDLIGTVEVLSTPAGNILKELFKNDIKLGISSRGLGSVEPVNEDGYPSDTVSVQDDFELIAFDFVSNPSTHGAFLSPVNESAGQTNHTPKYHKVNQIINDIIAGE